MQLTPLTTCFLLIFCGGSGRDCDRLQLRPVGRSHAVWGWRFYLFGIGALPAGRLGDLWGRRQMMLVFFFGMGVTTLLAAISQSAWQLAAALTLMGAFASIYHPVGIPMLVQYSTRPGLTIGFNGLAGNLGVAVAALLTGFW